MSVQKQKAREEKKRTRIQQGQILAGAKPAPSREEIAKLVIQHLDARILDIRKLLVQIDRMLTRRRWQGLVAGLGSR
jgi:hypothetical protein